MSDPTNYNDPWEPHWLPDAHPDDRAAIGSTFAGIHPYDLIPHDMPSHLATGLGLPESLVPASAPPDLGELPPEYVGAPVPVDPNGWNPAITAEPPPSASIPLQPGTGLPGPLVDQATAPPQLGALLNPENPNAIGSIHTETNAERYSGDPLANPVESERDQAAADMAMRDPVAFAQLEASHKLAADNHLAAALLRASEDDRWAAEQNWKNRQEAEAKTAAAMADLNAQTNALMAKKIDPGRMMRNRSGFTKMVDLIGAIAGGIAVGQSGGNGPNRYLENLNHLVDQDIDAQKFDIENGRQGINTKRSILAEEYARTGNLYQSAEAVRIAAKTAARDQILTQQQLYDPSGTRFFTLGQAAADMTSRIAAGQQALADKHLDQELKIGDHNLRVAAELRAQRADAEKAAHDAALLALKKSGGSGGGKKPEEMVTRESLILEGVDPALIPPGYVDTRKAWDIRTGSSKKSSEASKALGEAMADAVPDVATEDGSAYRAASPEEAAKLRDKKSAVEKASDLMDNVLRLREKYGWSSDLLKSKEWREMKASWGQLKLEKKNVEELGAISGSDLELMNDALGASDPTSVQDPSDGIRAAKRNMISGVNTDLSSKRRAGSAPIKPWSPVDRSHSATPVETNADKAQKKALGRAVNPGVAAAEESGRTVAPAPQSKEEKAMEFMLEPKMVTSTDTGGMDDEHRAAIDALADLGDVEKLQNIAVHAPQPGTRAYAIGKMMVAHGIRAAKGAKK